MNSVSNKRRKKGSIKEILFSLLAVLGVSLYPTIFLYAQNASEASASELTSPLLTFGAMGLLLFLIFSLITRKLLLGSVIASVSMLLLLNFTALENVLISIFPDVRYWHCAGIILFIIVHLILFLPKFLSSETSGFAVRIIAAVFSLLIVLNVAMAVPTIYNKMETQKEIAKRMEATASDTQAEAASDLPNIYYIILDEYSGLETIKKVFNYDNEPFAQKLESLGFAVSRNSYNEWIETTFVTANLIDLSYAAEAGVTSDEELNVMRQNGRLFQIVKEQGYSVQGVGAASYIYGLNRVDDTVQSVESKTISGESFSQLLFKQTLLYPFMSEAASDKQADILKSFEFMKNIPTETPSAMFTIAHLVFPHEPFLFDENGGKVNSMHRVDWTDTKYYVGQYKYCNKLIAELMENLIREDPDSIIILQSDHSARAASNSALFGRLVPYNDMKNILNAVYFGGESIEEIQGHSGVNTLRILLNKLFGYNFEVLDVPIIDQKAIQR